MQNRQNNTNLCHIFYKTLLDHCVQTYFTKQLLASPLGRVCLGIITTMAQPPPTQCNLCRMQKNALIVSLFYKLCWTAFANCDLQGFFSIDFSKVCLGMHIAKVPPPINSLQCMLYSQQLRKVA